MTLTIPYAAPLSVTRHTCVHARIYVFFPSANIIVAVCHRGEGRGLEIRQFWVPLSLSGSTDSRWQNVLVSFCHLLAV